jgi:hypothetical protein
MSSEAKEVIPPTPAKLSDNQKLVLRLVRCGDVYRQKAPGPGGRAARDATLAMLASKGLIIKTKAGFWQLTVAGREMT